jgi:hypothetical protein
MKRRFRQFQTGGECFMLEPKVPTKMKTRYIVAVEQMPHSGFHLLVSPKEAEQILGYLKEGDVLAPATANATDGTFNSAWVLAKEILFFLKGSFNPKDPRKRQALDRSVKGLVGEFAHVFKITLKEAADKILRSLKVESRTNPSLLLSFSHAVE